MSSDQSPEPVSVCLLALTHADRGEVLSAVAAGRAVEDSRLAAVAVDYAAAYQRDAGPAMLRKWWYPVVVVIGAVLVSFPLTWIGGGVLVIVAAVVPFMLRRRVERAARAERLNRDLIT